MDIPPVVTKVYDLNLWFMQQMPKFPRSHRFVLGDRIQTLSLDILENLIEAAYTRDKLSLLKRTGINIEKLRYLIRASHDLSFLSMRQYQFVAEQLDEIGRMIGGWQRQQQSGASKSS